MPAPRIGIDVTSALTQGGGIGRYTRELVRAVIIRDTGFNFRLFSARPPATLPVPDPLPRAAHVQHRPSPLSEKWLYRLWYRARLPLPVQWATGPLDLFHSPDFVLPPVSGAIPTVLTVHDLSFVHFPETFPPALVAYLNRVVPWSVARATHVLADSEATQHDLVTLWHIDPRKITVLYSGVSAAFQPVDDAGALTAVRRRYGLGESPYFLAVGTVQPRKNYELLVRALARIGDRVPHTLVIAGGRGWLDDALQAEIARSGLGARVRLLGFVDDADLPALYSDAAALLMPSLYEGFGLPVLEAMACATPALISSASSLPEVGGPAAWALAPDDENAWAEAMLQLHADPQRQADMVAAGHRQVAKFSWERAAIQLTGVYQTLLDKQRLSGHNKPTTRHNVW